MNDHSPLKADGELLSLFENQKDFVRVLIDGFVLVNQSFQVLKFNSAFCQISGLKAVDVRKILYLDQMLKLKVGMNENTVLKDLIFAPTPTRIDEVSAVNLNSEQTLTLIMSSYPYSDSQGEPLGAFILIRDVTAESNLQNKYRSKSLESITDPLTGLYTRRFFESYIEKELARRTSRNASSHMAVMMLDLDKFKGINDKFGHQAGDYVLTETARVLRSCARRSDIIGRYGGEEILVLIEEATEKTAAVIAEKFRTAIQNNEYIFLDKRIPVTVSIGVTLANEFQDTKDSLVKRADESLYKAKELGRNRVIVNYGDGPLSAIKFLKM